MGISLLELVQNRFPFPSDMPPIELMIYITQSEVRISFQHRGYRISDCFFTYSHPNSRMKQKYAGAMP
jgi:hypothetical protein